MPDYPQEFDWLMEAIVFAQLAGMRNVPMFELRGEYMCLQLSGAELVLTKDGKWLMNSTEGG